MQTFRFLNETATVTTAENTTVTTENQDEGSTITDPKPIEDGSQTPPNEDSEKLNDLKDSNKVPSSNTKDMTCSAGDDSVCIERFGPNNCCMNMTIINYT